MKYAATLTIFLLSQTGCDHLISTDSGKIPYTGDGCQSVTTAQSETAPASLNDRISFINTALAAGYDPTGSYSITISYFSSDGDAAPQVRFDEQGNGYLSYNDTTGYGHLHELNTDGTVGSELVNLVTAQRSIDDFTASFDGLTLLEGIRDVTRPDNFNAAGVNVVQYNLSGGKKWDKQIVYEDTWANEGDHGYSENGTIAFDGTSAYGIYFPGYRKWDDGVVHQGDFYLQASSTGSLDFDIGWSWGTSHSFRPKIVHNGEHFVLVTVGDAYPKGLHYYIPSLGVYERMIVDAVSTAVGDNSVSVAMGDVYEKDGTVYVAYDLDEGRTNRDIGLARIEPDGSRRILNCLTDGGLLERAPKITSYNDELLFVIWAEFEGDSYSGGWRFPAYNATTEAATATVKAALVDHNGALVSGPETIDGYYRGNSKFFNFQNGDIGWVSDVSDDQTIDIYRLSVQ